MTDASPIDTAPSSDRWFRGRPRSWPFYAIGSVFLAIAQMAPLLLFRRPDTPRDWLKWFLMSWTVVVMTTLFRDPVLDNPFARRLSARTDPAASGARVVYLLAAFAFIGLVWLLVMAAFFSWGGALVRPS